MTDRQLDFFIPSIADPPLRDQLDLMDLPLLSLAKTKRTKPIEFRRVTTKGEVRATVTSGPGGIATIQDYDVLIWATSHIMAAKQAGLATAAKIDGASAYEILKFTGRSTGPRAYGLLWSAIDRLVDTTIRTSVRTERGGRDAVFHWLERADKTVNAAGKVTGLSITLPQWLYQGIENNNVLSISADYFNLPAGLNGGFIGSPGSGRAINGRAGILPSTNSTTAADRPKNPRNLPAICARSSSGTVCRTTTLRVLRASAAMPAFTPCDGPCCHPRIQRMTLGF